MFDKKKSFEDIGNDISVILFETIDSYERGEKFKLVNILLKALNEPTSEVHKNVISLELIVIFYISALLGIKECNLNIKNFSIVTSTMRSIVTRILSKMFNSDEKKLDKWLGERLISYSNIIFKENNENIHADVFLHFLANIQDVLETGFDDSLMFGDAQNEFIAILIAFPETISKLIKKRLSLFYYIRGKG